MDNRQHHRNYAAPAAEMIQIQNNRKGWNAVAASTLLVDGLVVEVEAARFRSRLFISRDQQSQHTNVKLCI